jgi:uncharacterized membrane protein YsdA (DUF1294 family)
MGERRPDMYENGVNVTYLLMNDDESDDLRGNWMLPERTVHLPGWCAGDPQVAVALYLFGHHTYMDLVRIMEVSE